MKTFLSLITLCAVFVSGFVAAQISSQTKRVPQFENDAVKVWKSVVLPNNPLPLHRHEHPRVIVALTEGTMEIKEDSGSNEIQQWEAGHAYWLPANLPGTLHTDVNSGDKPIEVIVVELLNED